MSGTVFEVGYAAAFKIARFRVTAAIRTQAVSSADRDDLVQELLIAVWLASDKFNPARASLRTFFERVIASRLMSTIRTTRRSATDAATLIWRWGPSAAWRPMRRRSNFDLISPASCDSSIQPTAVGSCGAGAVLFQWTFQQEMVGLGRSTCLSAHWQVAGQASPPQALRPSNSGISGRINDG